ncbi:hypothetical protein SBA3_650006 [Candidatus Sulfopaludibacter sp. SbA3]|nr:hypothetical protein SBA3_650006 [Candidatus Sulfopaludibacter sp. SbA3]
MAVEASRPALHSPLAAGAIVAAAEYQQATAPVAESLAHPISPPPPLVSTPLRA